MKRIASILLLTIISLFTIQAARPKVVAHRGYWKAAGSAQNSLRSLIKADSIGADMSEFDVWMAADDVLVVDHDGTINGYVIQDTPSTTLRQEVCLVNGETIPTLEEYLDTARDLKVGLVLEIKWHNDPAREALCVEKAVNMVRERGLEDRTIYITFSPNAHAELGRHGVPHYFLNGKSPQELVEMGSDGPDFHYEVYYKNTDWIPEFKRLGMPINVWTLSTPDITQDFIDLGVDYLTTDTPELAIKLLSQTPTSKDIRVMDFNLEGTTNFDAAAAVIRAENPDFVTLQGLPNNADLNRLGLIAEMYMYYAAGGDNHNGVAILSRRTPLETKTMQLPNQFRDTWCPAIIATYDLGNGILINVASAWLTEDSDVTRDHQAEFITRKLRDAGLPAVLGVALNDGPKSKPFQTMRGRFGELSTDALTFPSPVPDRKMDFLLSYPADQVTRRDAYARPTTASFHMPTIADITVK